MERLKRRMDFRAAAGAVRAQMGAFVLQARRRSDEGDVRVGFTVSRQVGNAVERNRVRRRLREVVRLAATGSLRSGHDYVLVGRRAALGRAFEELKLDLDKALRRIHAAEPEGTGGASKRPLHKASSRADKGPPPNDSSLGPKGARQAAQSTSVE